MSIQIKNNFQNLKQDFKKDTGYDANKNLELYIQYYNARMNDQTWQMTTHILNKLENIAREIAFEIRK